MLDTSIRLLRMLTLLHERRFWSGPDLAETLEVTTRSVRRDVDRLRSLGYPVHASGGVGGGYALGAGQDLPPLPLDDDEAVAVALGLRAAAAGPVRGLEEASVRALSKLEAVLPKRLRRRVNDLAKVSVSLSGAGAVDGRVLAEVAAACREEELLAFVYRRRDEQVSQREVEPYRLVHTSTRWYLVAWDRARRDWRSFRLDRMTQPARRTRFSPRPLPDEDVAAWVTRNVSTEAYPVRAKVRVFAPADEVRGRVGMNAVVTGDGPGCVVELGAENPDGLALYLAYLGLPMEVVDSEPLREAFRRLAERARGIAEG